LFNLRFSVLRAGTPSWFQMGSSEPKGVRLNIRLRSEATAGQAYSDYRVFLLSNGRQGAATTTLHN